MAHTEELVGAAVAAWGTRALAGRGEVPWARLETAFDSDWTGMSARPSRTRAYPRSGDPRTVDAWFDGLREGGARRMGLMEPGEAARPGPTRACSMRSPAPVGYS